MEVKIRKFNETDIPNKIEWINNPLNNQFLHYNLPLQYDKTLEWYQRIKDSDTRFDAVIEYNSIPCGLIGLLSIDRKNLKAEFYISMGIHEYKGKGIATRAGILLLQYAFQELQLNRVYLYTEKDNTIAQKLFEKIGFEKEGLLKSDLNYNGRLIDRYCYGICKQEFEKQCFDTSFPTPIVKITDECNSIFIKRDDLIPFSFGGNKARKASYFFKEIDCGDYDCVVTYGSSSSNHCRVIANMAATRNLPCYIISPEETSQPTYNSQLMNLFGAIFTVCPVSQVQNTIDNLLNTLASEGHKPYFIAGGGHGNLGTQAYVDCYREILEYENEKKLHFDYIFFASGTGTTQAGLVCGKLIFYGEHQIIGISIARKNPRGRNVVLESIYDYSDAHLLGFEKDLVEKSIVFVDEFTGDGYGKNNPDISNTISDMMIYYGIPMDSTYVAKAYYGMLSYIQNHQISDKKILFIHTGGTPLFFNHLNEFTKE